MRLIVQFIGQAVGVMLLRRRLGSEKLPFKMCCIPCGGATMFGWAWLSGRPARPASGHSRNRLRRNAFLIRAREMREWPLPRRQCCVPHDRRSGHLQVARFVAAASEAGAFVLVCHSERPDSIGTRRTSTSNENNHAGRPFEPHPLNDTLPHHYRPRFSAISLPRPARP